MKDVNALIEKTAELLQTKQEELTRLTEVTSELRKRGMLARPNCKPATCAFQKRKPD